MEKKIVYFKKGSSEHSEAALQAAKERALEIKPEAVIVTSTSGKTGAAAARIFRGTGFRIIVVPFQKQLAEKNDWKLNAHAAEECKKLGAEFLPEEPVCKILDDDRPDIVKAWRTVSQGFKVAQQVATMCVDTGLIKPGAHVISLGGTGRGADTAIALKSYGYNDVLKNNVTEIIAMPQT